MAKRQYKTPADPMVVDVLDVIRERLDETGATQRGLARASGVSQTYISVLLSNPPPAVAAQTLFKTLRGLGGKIRIDVAFGPVTYTVIDEN